MNKLLTLLTFLVFFSFSCTKPKIDERVTPPLPSKKTDSLPPVYNYKSDRARNLNIIYFIPNDVPVPANHHRRLSEILQNFQTYIGNEMKRNGYGYKTFGLLKDDVAKRVKLIEIKGKYGKVKYDANGAAGIMDEIEAYKASHAGDFTSDHNLIILPAYQYDTLKGVPYPVAMPYFGWGRSCFTLDYADMDIKYLGKLGQYEKYGWWATMWIGGMLHELGHAFNLPHNCQKVSENETLGDALMWKGNSTYGLYPTFLTATDCAILNVNQVFNDDNQTYYGQEKAHLKKLRIYYNKDKNAIVVSGKFAGGSAVKDIVYYNDPKVEKEDWGVAYDYNAVTWASKPINNDSLYIEMPLPEYKYKGNYEYEIRVKLVCSDGNAINTPVRFFFKNDIPLIDKEIDNSLDMNKDGWKISDYSSQEDSWEQGQVAHLIDNRLDSHWHSGYSKKVFTYPHYIVIDIGLTKIYNGISLWQRIGKSRAVKDAEILVSTDGVNFTRAREIVLANEEGGQKFKFDSPLSFRYIKVIAKSAWDGQAFAALAEVGLY